MCSACVDLTVKSKNCKSVNKNPGRDLEDAIKNDKAMSTETTDDFIIIINPTSKCDPVEQSAKNYKDMASHINVHAIEKNNAQAFLAWYVIKNKMRGKLVYTWDFEEGYQADMGFKGGQKAEAGSTVLCSTCINDYTTVHIVVGIDSYGSQAVLNGLKNVAEMAWDGVKVVGVGVVVLYVGALLVMAIVITSPFLLAEALKPEDKPGNGGTKLALSNRLI